MAKIPTPLLYCMCRSVCVYLCPSICDLIAIWLELPSSKGLLTAEPVWRRRQMCVYTHTHNAGVVFTTPLLISPERFVYNS